jgi:hypothetical protein
MRIAFMILVASTLAGCVGPMCEPSMPVAVKARPGKLATAPESPPAPSKVYPCDCPDDRDSIGRRCGGRSACLREGGRMPVCPGYVCR